MKVTTITKVLMSGLLAMMTLASCRTTSPIVKVNKEQNNITVYSSTDRDSSLARANDDQSIDQAIAKIKEKLKTEPKNVNLLVDLSRLYLLKRALKQSRETCVAALSYDIHNIRANRLMAEIEISENQFDKAEVILNRLGGFNAKDADILNLLALIALKRGGNDEAYEFFQQGLKIDERNVAIKMNLGTLFLKFRQMRSAETQFAQVLEIFPEHVDALIHLGITKSYFGAYDEAESLYEKALDLSRNNILATYNYALLDRKKNKLDDSLQKAKLVLATSNLTVAQQKSAQTLHDEVKAEINRRDREEDKKNQEEKSGSQSLAAKLKPEDKKGEKSKDTKNQAEKGTTKNK